MASSRVTEDARKKANLRVLQRLDPSIVDIIGSATHVVLYEFKDARQEWEKSNVEGSVFVVKRNLTDATASYDGGGGASDPATRFKLIILNRNSTENMAVPITGDFQMQLREPYIIIRDTSGGGGGGGGGEAAVIRGIWFHSGEERGALYGLLDRVVKSQAHVADLEQRHVKDSPDATEVVLAEPAAATSSTSTPRRRPDAATAGGAVDAGAATEALLSPLSLSAATSSDPATAQSPKAAETPTPSSSAIGQPVVAPTDMVLDKKTLQLTLLSLIQDERFLDLIHAQYLKVARAKASGHGGTPGGKK